MARADASADQLAEIVVTAEKRSEKLSEVPMSITAVTGDELAQRGISSTSDLERIVPGFTYQDSQNGLPIYALRGIGFYDASFVNAPAVSVYLDEVVLPFTIESQGVAFDLQRVEVLKGPQGTLFGENSTGGAINYIAAKPTAQLAAGVRVDYGRFNEADVEGFISGPLADSLATRLAVRHESRDAWQQSYTRSDTLGSRDFTTLRWSTDWHPSEAISALINLNGWLDNSQTLATQYIGYAAAVPPPHGEPEQAEILPAYPTAPANDRAADWDRNAHLKHNDRFYQASVRLDWDIARSMTLTSLSAYSHASIDQTHDMDGTSFADFTTTMRGHLSSTSEELRLAGAFNSLKYLIGGNYERQQTYESDYGQDIASNSGVGPLRFYDFLISNSQHIKTTAGFGSVNYSLTKSLSLRGSARYTAQDRAFTGCLTDPGDGALASALGIVLSPSHAPLPPGQCVTFFPDGQTGVVRLPLNQTNVSWRAGADWKLDDGTLLYGNVSRGYKAGAFDNVPAIFSRQFQPVGQESVLAYELGFKTRMLGSSLALDGALFYYDYRDKQLQGYVPVPLFGQLPGLVSVPRSSVKGIELNAIYQPMQALKLNIGGTYIETRVDRSFVASDPFSGPIDLYGEQFPNTPRWQIKTAADYRFPLGERRYAFVAADLSYRSDSYAAFGNEPQFLINSYCLLGMRTGIEAADGHWRAELWGRNLTDRYYWVNVAHVIDTVTRSPGMPLTYGISLAYRY